MIRFSCDYGEGCHPEILAALAETNLEQTPGYSEDEYTHTAAGYIRQLCAAPNAAVHFVVGGTQANLLVLCAALRPWQGVIAPVSGHISVHETGAIEATGHKVLAQPCQNGKLTAAQVDALVKSHWADPNHEHVAMPAACYISHPTEYGSLYTAEELRALRRTCDEHGLILYMDGARMGYALTSGCTDVDLPLIAQCCDAFTIGGTKVGALFGEAIVIQNPAIAKDFRYLIKQRGALLAKGRLLGIQFCTLFRGGADCLYLRGAAHGMAMAKRLVQGLEKAGVSFLLPPQTNQIFPILKDETVEALARNYSFDTWEKTAQGQTAVRLCTAWSTKAENVDALLADVSALM